MVVNLRLLLAIAVKHMEKYQQTKLDERPRFLNLGIELINLELVVDVTGSKEPNQGIENKFLLDIFIFIQLPVGRWVIVQVVLSFDFLALLLLENFH